MQTIKTALKSLFTLHPLIPLSQIINSTPQKGLTRQEKAPLSQDLNRLTTPINLHTVLSPCLLLLDGRPHPKDLSNQAQ